MRYTLICADIRAYCFVVVQNKNTFCKYSIRQSERRNRWPTFSSPFFFVAHLKNSKHKYKTKVLWYFQSFFTIMVTLGNNVKIIEELILFGWMNIKILTSNKILYATRYAQYNPNIFIYSWERERTWKFYVISRAGIWGKNFIIFCGINLFCYVRREWLGLGTHLRRYMHISLKMDEMCMVILEHVENCKQLSILVGWLFFFLDGWRRNGVSISVNIFCFCCHFFCVSMETVGDALQGVYVKFLLAYSWIEVMWYRLHEIRNTNHKKISYKSKKGDFSSILSPVMNLFIYRNLIFPFIIYV